MKKKLMAALLVAALSVTTLVGCGGDSNGNGNGGSDDSSITLDKSYPEETVKIGFIGYDSTSEQQIGIQTYFDYLSEYYNIEVMYSDDLSDAQGELDFIADCAAAGCKAIIGYYNEAKEEAAKTAADYQMYYWGGFGGDETAYNAVKDNEYYLGGYTLGDAEYNAGKSMAEALVAQGCEKIVLCSGGASFGVPMFVQRTQGFTDAIDAAKAEGKNVEIVKEVQGWPGTDSFTADQTTVLGMDVDAIASTFDVAMWFQPVLESGKDSSIKLAAIGEVSETYHDFFNSGLVSVIVYDNEEVVFGNAIPMILNAVDGNKLTNADGTAPIFEVQRWTVTTPDEFNSIYELHEAGNYIISAGAMAENAIVHFNDKVTRDSFAEYYGNFSLENVGK